MRRTLRERAQRALGAARTGRGFGYPPCCIAAYCWSDLLDRWHALDTYCDLGHDWSSEWVPCGVFHERPAGVSRRSALWRVLRRGWNWVGPGGAAWHDLRSLPREETGLGFRDEDLDPNPYDPATQNPSLDPELDWF